MHDILSQKRGLFGERCRATRSRPARRAARKVAFRWSVRLAYSTLLWLSIRAWIWPLPINTSSSFCRALSVGMSILPECAAAVTSVGSMFLDS